MTGYADIAHDVARRVAAGDLAEGAPLPSIRARATAAGVGAATAARAYRELAVAGVVQIDARRVGHVAPGGRLAAARLLRGRAPFRLAGSDDPALDLLTAATDGGIVPVGLRGSFAGLAALWQGTADGATMHVRHLSGEENAPFARTLLHGRDPVLVHLWRREQGLLVAPGNPLGVEGVADLAGRRLAQRSHGTGTRVLLDRLLRDAGLDADAVRGPTLAGHLEVAVAVASGVSDTGMAVRSAAAALGLDFVPLAWEAFDLALPGSALPGAGPLVDRLRSAALREEIAALGGYDLTRSGEVRAL